MATRLHDCDEATMRGRLAKAEQFLEVAENTREFADDEAEVGDALVSLYVLAGIAASDVLCCKSLGHYVQGDDHQQAVAELSKVTPGGKALGKDLRALLALKSRAGYGATSVRTDERKRACRRAESLVEAARTH
ncbi:MAG: hypothetical protein ACRDPE_15505 [Solirubrobacterales bacterium]